MAKIGVTSTYDIVATLAGAPGSFEGTPVISVVPPDVATAPVLSADNKSFTINFLEEADYSINVTVDNLAGDAIGSLSGSVSGTVLPADQVVLADALAVTERA